VAEGEISNPTELNLIRGIKGNVFQHFVAITRDKVMGAMVKKAENAEYCGGLLPYGFSLEVVEVIKISHNKQKTVYRWVLHPVESRIVLFIKEMYIYGTSVYAVPEEFEGLGEYGSHTISKIVNKLGFTRRNGKPFNASFVKKLIRDDRDRHTGTFSYGLGISNKEIQQLVGSVRREKPLVEIRGKLPRIVSDELQKACKAKMKGIATKLRLRNNSLFSVQRTQYLGSGCLRCSACGGVLVGRTRTVDERHRKPEQRYECRNRCNASGVCHEPMIQASGIHDVLDYMMRQFLEEPESRKAIINETLRMWKARSDARPDATASIIAQLTAVRRKIGNLVANLTEAGGLGRTVRDMLLQMETEEETLQANLSGLQDEKDRAAKNGMDIEDKVQAAYTSIVDLWNAGTVGQKNQLIKALVREAVIDTRNKTLKATLAIPVKFLTSENVLNLSKQTWVHGEYGGKGWGTRPSP
jgi:hypothetical protein